jgi:hypothetical protein
MIEEHQYRVTADDKKYVLEQFMDGRWQEVSRSYAYRPVRQQYLDSLRTKGGR